MDASVVEQRTLSLPPSSGPQQDRRPRAAGRGHFRTWSGIFVSISAHAAVFGGAWLYAHYAPPRTVPERPIMAKLVQLGTPRNEKFLPRLPPPPSSPPPSSASAPPKLSVPVTITVPPPTPGANAADAPTPATPEQTKKEEARAEDAIAHQKRLAEALAKLESPPTNGPTGKKPQEKVGQKDGSPLGDAETAEEGDRYTAQVVQTLKANFIVPTTISQQERLYLSCDLLIFIASDGKIVRYSIEKSSGNAMYDRAVEATLQRSELAPPPASLKKTYGEDGLPLRFKP